MAAEQWEVVEGMGARHLEYVAQEIDIWNSHGDELETLEERALQWRSLAQSCVQDTLRQAFDSPDSIEAKILELTADNTDCVVSAARADAFEHAAHRLKQRRHGVSYPNFIEHSARLTVLEPGVMVEELKALMPGWTRTVHSQRLVAPGEVLNGQSPVLNGSPEQGGLLRIRPSRRRVLEITGLISVETAEPRVKLEILRRPTK